MKCKYSNNIVSYLLKVYKMQAVKYWEGFINKTKFEDWGCLKSQSFTFISGAVISLPYRAIQAGGNDGNLNLLLKVQLHKCATQECLIVLPKPDKKIYSIFC